MNLIARLEKILPICVCLYLALIGIVLGGIIVCGAIVAPVIFNAEILLPQLNATQYDSGILMTQIFIRLNYLLTALAFFIIVFETFNYRLTHAKITPFLGYVSVILIFIFTLFHTPFMVEAQKEGVAATKTEQFVAIHTQSELLFKILFVSLLALFCLHIYRLYRRA